MFNWFKKPSEKMKGAEPEVPKASTGEKPKAKPKVGFFKRLESIGTVSPREVVELTRHLSVMLGAGVTIFEAVIFLKDQIPNKVFKARLESVVESLNNGQPLSSAMSRFPKVFPPIYTNIIRVGEQSGTLSQTMLDLADHLEDTEQFKRRVNGALIYPKIILGVMLTFIFILALFVMPRILTVFKSLGADLPLSTKVIIAMTTFVNQHLLLILVTIFGLVAFVYFLMKLPSVRLWRDFTYLHLPLVGPTILNYNTAQVSQHFGTLFASGIPIIRCLEITQSVMANKAFQDEMGYMVDRIKNGASLSQSFPEKSNFPPMFVKMIRVGERTGKLPHVIEYMKKYYKGLVDNDVGNITAIIEPVIMILLGLMVTGLVVTVIGPIYQLISNIGKNS
jgi:type IV pilus assembly protein PilC